MLTTTVSIWQRAIFSALDDRPEPLLIQDRPVRAGARQHDVRLREEVVELRERTRDPAELLRQLLRACG